MFLDALQDAQLACRIKCSVERFLSTYKYTPQRKATNGLDTFPSQPFADSEHICHCVLPSTQICMAKRDRIKGPSEPLPSTKRETQLT